MQASTTARNPQSLPAMITIVGCAIAIIGSLLDWWTVSGDIIAEGERTETGLNWSSGTGTLFFGIVVIVLAVIMWFRGSSSGGRGLAIAAFVVSIFLLLAGAFSAFAPEDAVQQFESSDVAEDAGISEAQAEAQIEAAFDQGVLEVEAELGTYIAAAGGLIALIGALMAIIAGNRARATRAPVGGFAATPPGATPPGAGGPGAAGPGATPGGGASTPSAPTGSTAPPPGTPPGGSNPPS